LLLGGAYAKITTSCIGGIIWRCRRLCRATSSFWAASTNWGASPKAKVYPNGRDPNVDTGLDQPSQPDPKAIARANQIEIRTDITKLYDLVSELKEQIEKTDPTATLSIAVVKKAQQIEKLAKHVKELAKG
jgi:hypothetical protein